MLDRRVLLFLLTLGLVGGAGETSAEEAAAQVTTKPLTDLRQKAETGDVAAQIDLGLQLLMPDRAQANCPEAIAWLQKAAVQKSGHAYYILGTSYQNGVCVAKDLPKAMALYGKGSDVGCGLCDVRMGEVYRATGAASEKILAAYEKAVAKGSIEGRFVLGRYLFENSKDEKSLRRAFDLIQQAAQSGGADAAYLLALMYGKGIGTEQNYDASHQWAAVAAALGHPQATEAYKIFSTTEMTPAQIEQGQALAKQMKQKLAGE